MQYLQYRCLAVLITLVILGGGQPALAQWESIGPYGGHAQIIAIDPSDHNHLYTATKKGQIYHSRDAGQWWKPLPFALNDDGVNVRGGAAVYDLTFSSLPQGRILLASSGGLLSSDSEGADWIPVQGGVPISRLDQILVVPGRPEVMYVLSRGTHEIWRSIDAGTEWTKVDSRGLEGTILRFMSVDGGQPFVVTENHGVFRLDPPGDFVQALHQAP